MHEANFSPELPFSLESLHGVAKFWGDDELPV